MKSFGLSRTTLHISVLLLSLLLTCHGGNEDCFKVHLERVECVDSKVNLTSNEPQLVETLLTVQNDEQPDPMQILRQENEDLKTKFTETYENLEDTLNTLKLKMIDWSQTRVLVTEQQEHILTMEKLVVTLKKRNADLTNGKSHQLKRVLHLQNERSGLVADLKHKKEELAASEVKNEVLFNEMTELRSEIAEVRREKAILSYMHGNKTKGINCAGVENSTFSLENELLKQQVADEQAQRAELMESLSETIAELRLNCADPVTRTRGSTRGNKEVLADPVYTDYTCGPFQCFAKDSFIHPTVQEVSQDFVEAMAVGEEPPSLLCDTDDEDETWIVIQRRINGSIDFNREFAEYVSGFGDLNGEFWLGLDAIHELTKNNDYMLRIDLEDWMGIKWFAEYTLFSVGAGDDYTLNVKGYRGNVRFYELYSFERLSGMKFTTVDKDQDAWRFNCASYRYNGKYYHSGGGGWWYRACSHVNLNGQYYHYDNLNVLRGNHPSHPDGIIWHTNKPTGMLTRYSFKRAQMKIRLRGK